MWNGESAYGMVIANVEWWYTVRYGGNIKCFNDVTKVIRSICLIRGKDGIVPSLKHQLPSWGQLCIGWKMEGNYHTVRTVAPSNLKISRNRDIIDTTNPQKYDRSLSWPDAGTSIKINSMLYGPKYPFLVTFWYGVVRSSIHQNK